MTDAEKIFANTSERVRFLQALDQDEKKLIVGMLELAYSQGHVTGIKEANDQAMKLFKLA